MAGALGGGGWARTKNKTPPIRRPRSSPPAFAAAQTETGPFRSNSSDPIRAEPSRSEPGGGGADRPRGRRREGRGGEGASLVKRSRREGSGGGGRGEKRSGRGVVPRKASRLRAGNGGTGTNLQAASCARTPKTSRDARGGPGPP